MIDGLYDNMATERARKQRNRRLDRIAYDQYERAYAGCPDVAPAKKTYRVRPDVDRRYVDIASNRYAITGRCK